MTAVMGIDPGVRGGVVVLDTLGRVAFVQGFRPDMLETDWLGALQGALAALAADGGGPCYLEKVGYIAGDGGQGAFTFGRVYGFLRGFLRARGVAVKDVYPMMWQARLGCLSGGDKNVTKRAAAAMFPEVKVSHAVADALLIAEYGRQTLRLRSGGAPAGL